MRDAEIAGRGVPGVNAGRRHDKVPANSRSGDRFRTLQNHHFESARVTMLNGRPEEISTIGADGKVTKDPLHRAGRLPPPGR